MINIDLGSYLKQMRRARGFTQLELSKLLGYSQQGVWNWESGGRNVPKNLLPKLVRILGIDKNDLIDLLTRQSATEWKRVLK
jgi:transcriptional regulator with XRE-family HTH domain